MFTKNAHSNYQDHAEHAAALERNGYYGEAAFAWTVVSQHARQPDNRHWAECRSLFCENWAIRCQRGKAA